MLSPELLARLSRLNAARPIDRPDEPPRPDESARGKNSAAPLPPGIEVTGEFGSHWLIEQSLDELWPGAESRMEQACREISQTPGALERLHPELRRLGRRFAQGTLFMDLETCGFAGSTVFLIGVICRRERHVVLQQLLARHYGEEKPMLQSFWRVAADHDVLVTFNGKSFDWPMVQDRSTLHHLGVDPRQEKPAESKGRAATDHRYPRGPRDPRPQLSHCDLLHHARRRWRSRLPNCRLQTLEQYICGRRRAADIPGREIPQAYHQFVRTGDAWEMRAILHHNALDLITLAQLSLAILRPPTETQRERAAS